MIALRMSGFVVAALALSLPAQEPVDWVNPEIGNISHMLVPTFQTTQLPNGMLRFIPPCRSFVDDRVGDLRLVVAGHRSPGMFLVHPLSETGKNPFSEWDCTLDQLHGMPYRCRMFIDSEQTSFDLAPSRRGALVSFGFERQDGSATLVFSPADAHGRMAWNGRALSGEDVFLGATAYLHAEFDVPPIAVKSDGKGRVALLFGEGSRTVRMRYAYSFISPETAAAALAKEIPDWDIDSLAAAARREWNAKLGKIEVEGGTEAERRVFYTALYRCYERMVNFTEDGRYLGYDGRVHDAGGIDYYNDDWTWDTYRAAHPLMCILEPTAEGAKLTSYLRMAEQNPEGWVPTFPQLPVDRHGMNGFHPPAMFLDARVKGVAGVDWSAAFKALAHTERTSSRLPWFRGPRCAIDDQHDRLGYMPAIQGKEDGQGWAEDGEFPVAATSGGWSERRQAVAVTLAYSYDAWCLEKLAEEFGTAEDVHEFREKSQRYRNLWKADTQFFHPRDKEGDWLTIADYRMAGGLGGRDYYDENNAWTYVWDVQHDIPGLVALFGGAEAFERKLDRLFNEPMPCERWKFLAQWPDSSGMMGMFSMGNEPSFHIPYLYSMIGRPEKTQKLVRKILKAWFRDDMMGMCGDEDGGGMSAFAVFSMMGFYPVTPGKPEYQWGSPVFKKVVIHQESGRDFVIEAPDASEDNKYIRGISIDGKKRTSMALPHEAILSGAHVRLKMSNRAF